MSREIIRNQLRSLRQQLTFEIEGCAFEGRTDLSDLWWVASDQFERLADCVEQVEQVIDEERRALFATRGLDPDGYPLDGKER